MSSAAPSDTPQPSGPASNTFNVIAGGTASGSSGSFYDSSMFKLGGTAALVVSMAFVYFKMTKKNSWMEKILIIAIAFGFVLMYAIV